MSGQVSVAQREPNVRFVLVAAVLLLALLAAVAGPLAAQAPAAEPAAPAAYKVDRYTLDGGGVTHSSGGRFFLAGTAGQPDAGEMAGGAYRLVGGFWAGGAGPAVPYLVYLPLVVR